MFCVDSWQTSEVRTLTDPKKDEKFVSELIYDLKPWTQYAIYVQTYTLATADRGAISSIVYFMTQPDGEHRYLYFIHCDMYIGRVAMVMCKKKS